MIGRLNVQFEIDRNKSIVSHISTNFISKLLKKNMSFAKDYDDEMNLQSVTE